MNMNICLEKPDKKDIPIIKSQVGGRKLFVHSIVARCKKGYPQILILNPIKSKKRKELNFETISNILWLSCPHLNHEIHQIETRGAVKEIQNIINDNRENTELMINSHANFYFFRKNLYKHVMGESYSDEHMKFFKQGIGGMKDISSVKCLHVHYAHYQICKTNIIGKLTESLLHGNNYCDGRLCECLKK